MRVHALAKEFGVKSTEFVDIIQGFGISVSSHLSGLDSAQVSDIRHKMILRKEFNSSDVDDMNPLGNLTQEEVDKVMVETNRQGESAEEFNARRREEIIAENKKIEEKEKLAVVVTQAKENKQEQLLKLERAGLWGWIKGLFS